jgi:hypothetical protein
MDNILAYNARWSKGIPADSAFFPIGMAGNAVSTAAAMARAGINVFIGPGDGPTLIYMRSNGIKLACPQNTYTLSASVQQNYGSTIVAWDQMDEPDNAQSDGAGGYDPCVTTDSIRHIYNAWKAADSTRPVLLNLGQGVTNINYIGRGTCTGNWQMYSGYIQGCDIVSYDIYPVSSSDATIRGNLWYLAKGVDSLRSWGHDQKPVWDWIECTAVHQNITPTPAQIKYLVWSSIIRGANGIQYFACKMPGQTGADYNGVLNDAVTLAAITGFNAEIKSLAPALNSNDAPTRASVQSSNGSVPVSILVKQCRGGLYIFAASMRSGTTTATFTVPTPPATTVTVLGEGRELNLTGTTFQDNFTSYGVHLYQIGGVVISVKDKPAQSAAGPRCLAITPNPFSASTTVLVQNTGALPASIDVYTSAGAHVRTLKLDGNTVVWDGYDAAGHSVVKGV